MNKIDYPVFLSKISKGEDKLEGGSQDKLAEVISNVIKEDKLEKKVIGLEGEWGSGKSNVIKIIQKKLGVDYHIFIFDAWGSQEDITRKSFLEQLIKQLFDFELLKEQKKWKSLKNNLLSNTTTSHTQKFPQIKPHWLIITLAILFFGILSSFFENVLKDSEFLSFLGILKPMIFIYLAPAVIFIWGIRLSLKEYNVKVEENEKKDKVEQDTKWEIIGKMFYWFNGNEIYAEEIQNIISEEPSVKQFREYLKHIEDELKDNKKLVLVFDNLDRLDKDKITALWSSIHTFFAEDYKSFDSWVIIPYDKKKLEDHLNDNHSGFISKTFSLNFRITPPVVTQWEAFLNDNFEAAFGNELIRVAEKEYVVKLFDILTSHNTIKPRQIINYLNDIVVLYKQWKDEVESGDIKFRYIALFALTKDKIIDSPNESILNRSYLGYASSLFTDDNNLDTSISMLTFGVKKELADEVLLDRQFKIALREGKDDVIKSSLNHKAFQRYFFKANKDVPLQEKYKSIVKILEVVKDTLSTQMMESLWKNFGKDLLLIDEQFESFNPNHEAILINTDKKIGEDIIRKIIRNSLRDFENEEVQIKYYKELKTMSEFIDLKNVDIDLFSLVQKVEIDSSPYLQFLELVKEDYKKFKINTNQDDIIDEFYNTNKDLLVDTVLKHLDEITILKDEYNIEKIIEDIISLIGVLNYDQKEELTKFLSILQKIGGKPLNILLSTSFYTQFTSLLLNKDEIYEDAFCISIANFQTAHDISSNFQNTLNDLTKDHILKISSKIETYISYEKLLKLIIENPNAGKYIKLKEIIYILTKKNNEISNLDVNWILKDFDVISNKVFDNDENKLNDFIRLINVINDNFTNEVKDISVGFFKLLNLQDLQIIKSITTSSLEYLKTLSKEQFFESFKSEDRNFKLFESLVNNNLIEVFTDAFYSAYDDYMKEIASENETLPNHEFWNHIMDKLNSNKLKSTFTRVRDIYINDRGEAKQEELYFFEKGLINHGNLSTKPEGSTLKIIIPLIKSDETFDFFLNNYEILIEVLKSSTENKESAIGELQLKYDSNKYRENLKMKKVAEIIKLKDNNSNSTKE